MTANISYDGGTEDNAVTTLNAGVLGLCVQTRGSTEHIKLRHV